MFEFLVQASLRNRLLVLALAAALMGLGAIALTRTPVDVFPSLDRPQVTLQVEAGGMAPEEVEQLVTLPLEQGRLRCIRHPGQLGLRARGGDHRLGAQPLGDLDGGQADTAGCRIDEHCLARAQFAIADQCVMRGDENVGKRGRFDPAERVGHPHQGQRIGQDLFGMSARAVSHHPVAGLPGPDVGARLDHRARELHSRGDWRAFAQPTRHRDLPPIDAGGVHPHQHLSGGRPRIGQLVHDRPPAVLAWNDSNRFQCLSPGHASRRTQQPYHSGLIPVDINEFRR